MPHYVAERLTPADASYLLFESPNAHMHLSWTWVFEAGSLATPDGGVDIAAIRQHVAARLFRFPRFRQRLAWTPVEGRPVWVDDERFKLHYHVRHAALPDPGDEARLRTTAAAIVSQPLDRSKPLWELWVVEGLQDGRFAIVSKTHHCMVDGVSTVDLMSGLLDAEPHARPEEPADWIPRPAPSPAILLRDGLLERAAGALRAARAVGRRLGEPGAWVQLANAAGGVLAAARARPPATPLNRHVGPHRLLGWLDVPLAPLRETAARLGATVQDVTLAAVADAVGRLLGRSGGNLAGEPLRVVVPVAIDPGGPGNRTAAAVVSLPIGEPDPRLRVRAIATATAAARVDGAGLHNLDLPLGVAAFGGRALLALGLAARRRLYACNLVVTDIAGPPAPAFLLDARLVATYPFVPLLDDQGLGIAFATYGDTCFVGLAADWEIVPGLGTVAGDLREALGRLADVAGTGPLLPDHR